MSALAAALLAEVLVFTLAATRVAGFVVTTPFPARSVPAHAKVGLVLTTAWVAHAAATDAPALGLDARLAGQALSELVVGMLIGFTLRVTLSAAEALGNAIAQATGMTLGQAYDPALGTEDVVIGRVATLLAMLLFVTLGAHRVVIAWVIDSFRIVPIGAGSLGAAAPPLVSFVGEALAAGVRLALPVTAVGLGVQTSLALVARASPSLQMFSVGLALTVAAGMLALLSCLEDAARGLAAEIAKAGPRIEVVLEAIRP